MNTCQIGNMTLHLCLLMLFCCFQSLGSKYLMKYWPLHVEVLKVTVSPTRFSQDPQQSNCPDIAPYQPLLDLLILNYGWQLWHITNQILRWRWKVKCWWYPSQVPQLPWMSLPEASGLGNLTNDIPASDDDACAPFPEVPELSRAQWGEKLKPLLCSVTAVEWGLWKSVIALGGESTKKK